MSDAVFIALACAFLFEVVTGKRRFIWRREYWVLVFYVGSFLPSLLVTVDLAQSLFKLTTQIYLIFLALLTASLVQSEARLRRAIFAWLFASAVVALLAIARYSQSRQTRG